MKRLALFIIALCLILTACSVEPEVQEPETQESEVTEPVIQEEVSPVYTDWSKLTPYNEKPVYTYYEPRSEDGYLEPHDDYGMLLDYMGEIQIESSEYLHGLVTTDGRLVTEPVYSYIYFEGAFMMLGIKEPPTYAGKEPGKKDRIVYKDFVAASDGSWIKELESSYGEFLIGKNYLAIKMYDRSLIILNDNGDIVSEFPAAVFKSHFGKDFEWHQIDELIGNGSICFSMQEDKESDNLYLDITTGTVLNKPKGNYTQIQYGSIPSDYDEVTADLISEIRDDYFCYYSQETGEVVFSYPIKSNVD